MYCLLKTQATTPLKYYNLHMAFHSFDYKLCNPSKSVHALTLPVMQINIHFHPMFLLQYSIVAMTASCAEEMRKPILNIGEIPVK